MFALKDTLQLSSGAIINIRMVSAPVYGELAIIFVVF